MAKLWLGVAIGLAMATALLFLLFRFIVPAIFGSFLVIVAIGLAATSVFGFGDADGGEDDEGEEDEDDRDDGDEEEEL